MSAVMTETPVKPKTPPQLVFECKLKGCDVTLELRTHGGVLDGVHRWTQLSAEALIKPKTGRGRPPLPPIRVTWAMADLAECRLEHWSFSGDGIWIGRASFDIEHGNLQRATKFLAPLGVEINDHTKDDRS